MIIGTITLLSLLFFGGQLQGPFFQLPNIEKHVKSIVENEESRDKTLTICKDYLSEVKLERKAQNKELKVLENLTKDKSTTKNVLSDQLNKIDSYELTLQKIWATARIEIQSSLKEEDFKKIVKLGVEDISYKKEGKLKDKRLKLINEIRESFEKNISNQSALKQCLEALNIFDGKLKHLKNHQAGINYRESPLLNRFDLTESELNQMIEDHTLYKTQVMDSYLNFHVTTANLVNDSEWKKINKSLSSLVNQ